MPRTTPAFLRTPFCRVGNKTNIIKNILPIIPKHKTYIEAFVGSGAVFFAKESAEKSIINDLDDSVNYLFTNLPKISSNKNDYNFVKGIENIQQYVNQDYQRLEDQFYKIILYMGNTFGCLNKGKIYKPHSHHTKFNKIKKYQEKMINTIVLQQDYMKVIQENDEEDAFIFLDPPYENSKDLYINSSIDYVDMSNKLKKVKGKFLLTINDSPAIREIFRDFNIYNVDVKGQGNKASPIGKGIRKELFITNYNI